MSKYTTYTPLAPVTQIILTPHYNVNQPSPKTIPSTISTFTLFSGIISYIHYVAPSSANIPESTMSFLSNFIAIALIIPFVAWGIYILRLQLTYREELETTAKWATIAGVIIFFIIELSLLRVSLGTKSIVYFLTTLALILSTAALYGHLFVSIASQMAVDIIHPPQEHEPDAPDFAPAEALEEVGDYKGALNEYLVIARIFPNDPDPVLKIADTYIHLDDLDEAVRFFEKGLSAVASPDRAIRITNRLSGIYNKQLNRPEEAKRILEEYLDRFPDSEHGANIQTRIEKISKRKTQPKVFKSATGLLEPPPTDLLG